MTYQKCLDGDVICERVKTLIKDRDLTQRYVAKEVGSVEQVLSNKLTGLRSFTMKDVTALADFFGVSTDYLLGRIDTPWPDPWEKNGKEAER